jgi:hypothetical protein
MSGVPIVPIAATYQRLRDENDRPRKALDEILNSIKHMLDEAEREGARTDEQVAIQLANDAVYLRGIAKRALEVGRDG